MLRINLYIRLIVFAMLFTSGEVMAQGIFQSIDDGDWEDATTWSFTGTDADGVPDANDNVTINNGHFVDIDNTNAACVNITLLGNGRIEMVQNALTLTVSGTMTMNGTSSLTGGAGGSRAINLLGPFLVPAGQTPEIDNVNFSQSASQNFTVLGELISTSAVGTKSAGNVFINSPSASSGIWTFDAIETWDVQSLTIYDGPVGQAIIGGGSTGIMNVLGNFSVIGTIGGQKSKIGRGSLIVSGTSNIAGWLLFTTSILGDKRFNNTITITNAGTWDNDIGEDPFINASVVNNGTWPLSTGATSGIYTVETAGSFTYTGTGTINMHRLIITQATITNQAALTLHGDPDQGLQVDNAATFTNGNGGHLKLQSTLDNVTKIGGGTGTIIFSTAANTVEYALAGAQNVYLTTYHKLVCSNSGIKQAGGTVTINSELNLTGTGTVYNAGTNTLDGAGNLVMTDGSELRLAKPGVNLPELTGTSNSLAAGTTINLFGNAAQTLKANSTYAYQNLSVSGTTGSAVNMSNVTTILGNITLTNAGAITTIPGGGLTVAGTYSSNSTGTTTMTAGNLTVGSIVFAGAGTFNYTGRTITVNGNSGAWTNNGTTTLTSNASSLVQFTTGTSQQISGSTATTFPNLTINNSNGVTINAATATISGTLNLAVGPLITGANKVIASSTVTRTTGLVQGNLQKPVATGTNVTIVYELGTGTTYAPDTVVFASVSGAGSWVAGETAGDHPQILSANIEPTSTVNRYYSFVNVGPTTFTTVSAKLTFVAGDVDGGFSPAVDASIKGYDPVLATWQSAPVGTRTTTSAEFITVPSANFPTNRQIDFQIGKRIIVSGFFNRLTGGPLDWHAATTWINNRDGTISVTNGNVNVTGSGTAFLLQLSPGEQIVLQNTPSLAPVTIQSITSNTALVLTAPYPHVTASGGYGRLRVPNSNADSVLIGNPRFNGGAGGADVATTIELTANAQVHTLAINEPPNGRTTAQVLTHIGTSQLTALNVSVNQPTGNTTDSWNINTGSAIVSGNLTIGSANGNNNRIAQVVMTTGSPTLTIGGDLIFRTNGNGSQVTAVLTSGSARINLSGNLQSIGNRATLTMGSAGVFNFNGTTVAQALDLPNNNPTSFVYSNIECNNTTTNGVQLAKDITTTNLTGNFRVLIGKFQMIASGSPLLTGTATKTFELANGTTLEMLGGGSQPFPTGFTTYTIGNTSTVIYGQTGNLSLPTTPSGYGHLMFSSNPIFTLPNGTTTVNGNITIGNGTATPDLRGSSATLTNLAVTGNVLINANGAITATNIASIILQGNWTNNGTFTPSTNIVEFGGNGTSQPQTIGGSAADVFYHLKMNTNDVTDLVRLSKDVTVSNTLTLTKGGIEINGNQLSVTNATTGAIVRGGGDVGYIKSETTAAPYSRLRRTINTATGTFVYPFGKTSAAADYIPFTCDITSAGGTTGTFEISTYATAADNTPYPSGVTNVISGLDNSGSQVVDRFWTLTRAGFTTTPTANITFSVTTGEATGIAGSLRAQRWTPGNVWEAAIPGQTNPTATSVTVPSVTSFSPWTLASNLTPLPIELLKFEARPTDGVVELNWETATEINNASFDVERSRDGEEFESIGNINGAGNSHLIRKYIFTDTYPLAGNAYYRLRQTDYDGKASYSWVLRVETTASFSIMAWPNPSNGRELNISWRDGEPGAIVSVRLLTQTGAKAFEGELSLDEDRNSTIDFDSPLSQGIYILETMTGSGVHRLKIFVK